MFDRLLVLAPVALAIDVTDDSGSHPVVPGIKVIPLLAIHYGGRRAAEIRISLPPPDAHGADVEVLGKVGIANPLRSGLCRFVIHCPPRLRTFDEVQHSSLVLEVHQPCRFSCPKDRANTPMVWELQTRQTSV